MRGPPGCTRRSGSTANDRDAEVRGVRRVPPPVAESAAAVVRSEGGPPGPPEMYGKPTKKAVPGMPAPAPFDGRKDLYALMSYRFGVGSGWVGWVGGRSRGIAERGVRAADEVMR
jgi:hypothetical protein